MEFQSNKKLLQFLINFPSILFWGYIFGTGLILLTPIGEGYASVIWGVSILFSILVGLWIYLQKNPIFELFEGLMDLIFFAIGAIILSIAPKFSILIAFLFWVGILGLIRINSAITKWKLKKSQSSKERKYNKKAILVFSTAFLISGSFLAGPFIFRTTHTYTITPNTAENFELVLYYVDKETLNTSLIDLCKSVNATISTPIYEVNFSPDNLNGNRCADAIRYANQQGVKIEVFPIFNRTNGWYPSYSETSMLMNLYDRFHNWTVFHNITVDYLMWDCEGTLEEPVYSGWLDNLGLGELGTLGKSLDVYHQRKTTWNETLNQWRAVNAKARMDGYTVRATVRPYIYDIPDQDWDVEQFSGTPSFSMREDYEYCSMMLYTSCEWNAYYGPEYVEQGIKQLKSLEQSRTAACIGCLGYAKYPTEATILNDVRVALGNGANSVRIFQGHTWVQTYGLESLGQILQASRQPGSAYVKSNPLYQFEFDGGVLLDTIYNLV